MKKSDILYKHNAPYHENTREIVYNKLIMGEVMRDKQINSSTFIKLFVTLFFVTLFLSTIVLTVYEYRLIKELKSTIIEEETIAVDTLSQVIGKDLKNVISDLEFMNYEMLAHYNENESLEQLWVHFLTSKKFYDQIRFIDVSGEELYRVNYNHGQVKVVSHMELQDKSHRYYFEDSIRLEKGQVYISNLDLNIENGEIEQPEKPMLRIALRVQNEHFDGIILVNYLGKYLLKDVEIFNQNTAGSIYLLNGEKDYLYHKDSEKTFAFMYEGMEENFNLDFPGVLDENKNKVHIIEDGNLFIMKHLDFNQMMEIQEKKIFASEDLLLVNHVYGKEQDILLDATVFKVVWQVFGKNQYAVIIIFFATLLISYLQYRIRKSKILFREMFEKDALTDIYNRRAGMDYFYHMMEQAKGNHDEVCVAFIDVDGLKQINDTLGHDYGDDLLLTITSLIKDEIREKDLFFRFGGDEFLLIFVELDCDIVKQIMTRIQDKLDYLNESDAKSFILSFSYGLSSTHIHETVNIEELIRIADERMYVNKKNKSKREMIKI